MTADASLLAAHAAGDGRALVALYREIANGLNDVDAMCFYLTHAFVFALEAGDADAIHQIHAILAAHGREPPEAP